MKRLSIFTRLSSVALGAGLALSVLGAPAVAQDQPAQTRVKVSDLDLTSPRGRAEAERRLQSSASSTCRNHGETGLASMAAAGRCKDDLVRNGRANLDSVSARQIAAKQEAERRAYAASHPSVGKARAHVVRRHAAKRRGHRVVHAHAVRHGVHHRPARHVVHHRKVVRRTTTS